MMSGSGTGQIQTDGFLFLRRDALVSAASAKPRGHSDGAVHIHSTLQQSSISLGHHFPSFIALIIPRGRTAPQ